MKGEGFRVHGLGVCRVYGTDSMSSTSWSACGMSESISKRGILREEKMKLTIKFDPYALAV